MAFKVYGVDTQISMQIGLVGKIYRKAPIFNGKIYGFLGKSMVSWENLWFPGKIYGFLGKSMVSWENLWLPGKITLVSCKFSLKPIH